MANMKLGLVVREKLIGEILARAKDNNACFFVGFNKLEAFPYNCLRNDLRAADAIFFVTKNSLFKRAFEDLGWKDFNEFLQGETGVVFVYDKDVVKTCKILVDRTKENEALFLKGAFLGEGKLTATQVKALAKLPPKEVLIGMAVGGLAAPITGFLTVLNQVILKFVWALEEIKKKKS